MAEPPPTAIMHAGRCFNSSDTPAITFSSGGSGTTSEYTVNSMPARFKRSVTSSTSPLETTNGSVTTIAFL